MTNYMSTGNENYMGESVLSEEPRKGLGLKLKANSVTTEKIAKGAVTLEKLGSDVDTHILEVIDDGLAGVQSQLDDLNHKIETYEKFGVAVSNEFGQNDQVSISQKVLTDAITAILSTLSQVTGGSEAGITMTVIPEYFTGATGCDLSISASSDGALGNFETIDFYVDEELVGHYEDVETVEPFTVHVDTNCVVKCVAKLMGMTYTKEQAINRVTSFFIGAGSVPADIMNEEHRHDIQDGFAPYYDIEAENGDLIMIIMDSGYESQFERADMNGFEIPFVIDRETISGYTIYKTSNGYNAGTYRIFINR